MVFLYNLFILLYRTGIALAALFNNKAAQWQQGRKDLWAELQKSFPQQDPLVWVHSASAGEFEQAKPLIEALRKSYPDHKIAVTFFSPSGFAVGKKWALADYVLYLPLDTSENAKRFISLLSPRLVVFIKYDYWYHHLKEVHNRQIPLLLVSAIFRKEQAFFSWYGSFYRRMLHFFTHLFVQDESSKNLLANYGISHCTVSGDTRFDRVASIAEQFTPIKEIEAFIRGKKTIVAGSTWPEDEQMLHEVLKKEKDVKLVIAPHEINEGHIKNIQQLFPESLLFSDLKKGLEQNASFSFYDKPVLIIDNIGMLSRLYRYATVAYIGGGFNKSGIHNTLEAAVWGKPVVWGPNYQKFREARDLLSAGGGFSYTTAADLKGIVSVLLHDDAALTNSGKAAGAYVQGNKGATQKIMAFIQEKRLLTRL